MAVLLTANTTNLPLIGLTRWLEGAAAGASIPSILGYIALATSRDAALRGRMVARFEAATLAGIGVGIVAAGPLWDAIARGAFVLNAGIYVASFVVYRWGVADVAGVRHADEHAAVSAVHAEPFNFQRYLAVLRSPGVWLLAPTWVALNAVLGSWTTQSVFQLVKDPTSEFAGQLLMGGFAPTQVSVGMAAAPSSSSPASSTGATGSAATGARRSSSSASPGGWR